MVWLEVAGIHCFELVWALLVQVLVETARYNLDQFLRWYNSKEELLRRDTVEAWSVPELDEMARYNLVQFLRWYNNMAERLRKDMKRELSELE